MPILKCRYIPTIKCDTVGKYEFDDPRRYEAMSDEQFQIFFEKPKPNYKGMAVYAKKQYGIDEFSMAKSKDVARKQLNIEDIPMEQREANFKVFEKRIQLDEPDPFLTGDKFEAGRQPMSKESNAYKKLKQYSETDYGATMIKKLNASPKDFVIYVDDSDGAKGGESLDGGKTLGFIKFPSNFTSKKFYKSTGQEIDHLAVIHHEFVHSGFVDKPAGIKNLDVGDLDEERFAVINSENPVRILNGLEPRYTYYNGVTDRTINILSGVTVDGMKTYDPNNPGFLK